jgi:hypothetical protein
MNPSIVVRSLLNKKRGGTLNRMSGLSLLNKKRRGTLNRMFGLREPSPPGITHFEIEATRTHYNIIDTLCL